MLGVIIYGVHLLGKTDEVPGVFYIKTKFFHIYYIPLCPVKSYLVLEEDHRSRRNGTFRGIEIPLHGKSVWLAYLRTIAVLGSIASFVSAMILATDPWEWKNRPGVMILIVSSFFIGIALTIFLLCRKPLQYASCERATEICSSLPSIHGALGLQSLVDQYFNENAVVGESVVLNQDHDDMNGPCPGDCPMISHHITPHDLELKEVHVAEQSMGNSNTSKTQVATAQKLEIV